MNIQTEKLFELTQIGELILPNRLAVAPMTRVSAEPNGCANAAMVKYYEAFARGGFGLIITEGTYTDQIYSQGYANQPGIATDRQAESWQQVVDAVHAAGGRIIMQLMHAGALAQHNSYRPKAAGPSAILPKGEQMPLFRGSGPYAMPQEMSEADIKSATDGFVESARRAKSIGFDGVEVHGANGYLLDQFLTQYTNLRDDNYGGQTAKRVKLTCDVVGAIRKQVGTSYVVGVRISQGKVNDHTHKWEGAENDAEVVFSELGNAGADFIHTTEHDALKPAFDNGPSLAALAARFAKLPIIANGGLHDPASAVDIITNGEATLVALGRGALANSDWPALVRTGVQPTSFDPTILQPLATLDNARNHKLSLEP